MSRYSATPDGNIAFVGGDLALVIERPAAASMLADLRRWADDYATGPIGAIYASWADDLEAAVNAARGGQNGRSSRLAAQ